MTNSIDSRIETLSFDERLALIDRLWASIEKPALAALLSDEQKSELTRRISEYEADPDDVLCWDELNGDRPDSVSLQG